MWLSITFVTLLAGMCLNFNTLRASEDDVGNANDYVDEVLQNLRNEPSVMSKLDPVYIPDVSESNFKLKGGTVRGLGSLYRHGDCTLEYDDDGTIRIVGEMAVRGVSMDGKYEVKAGFFWIKGEMVAELVHLALNVNMFAKDGKISLDSLKVANLGNYNIKRITGMSVLFNWLLKIIANSIANKSRGKIIDAIEGPAAQALRNELAKVKFPGFGK